MNGDPLGALIAALENDLQHASVPATSADPRQRPAEPLLYVYRLGEIIAALRDVKYRLDGVWGDVGFVLNHPKLQS